MVIVLEDDACLHVYGSVDAVVRQIEALDADDVLRAVYDDNGQRYRIRWIRPNRRRWLGAQNGEYELVPDGTPSIAQLTALLESHRAVDSEAGQTIERILQRLKRRSE